MAGRVIRRGAKWGGITGTLSAQTDLQDALNAKVSANTWPTLTGVTLNTLKSFETVANPNTTATTITPNDRYVICNPVSQFLWHDLFGFCRLDTPVQETSVDGVTGWTGATLQKELFSHRGTSSYVVLNAAVNKGVRWTWDAGIAWAYPTWLVMGLGWNGDAPSRTVTIESWNGSAWTVRHQSTYNTSSEPVWHYCGGINGDSQLRLTITTAASTGSISIAEIRLLTSRWGDQGRGDEISVPYDWDKDMKISLPGNSLAFAYGGLIDNTTDDTLLIKGATDTASGGIKMLSSNGASGSLEVTNAFAGVTKNGEAYSRTIIQYADGKIGFGPGTATRDTWLYRDSASSLKTDGKFTATGRIDGSNIVDLWDATKTYADGDSCVYGGVLWLSNTGSNLGNEPGVDAGWGAECPIAFAAPTAAGQVFTSQYPGISAGQWTAPTGFTKTGSGTFASGTTHTVTDPWITASTFVSVSPTGTKAGTWTVDSAAGSFTITSTASESGVTFDWGAMK